VTSVGCQQLSKASIDRNFTIYIGKYTIPTNTLYSIKTSALDLVLVLVRRASQGGECTTSTSTHPVEILKVLSKCTIPVNPIWWYTFKRSRDVT
jgi:hypothetical protein